MRLFLFLFFLFNSCFAQQIFRIDSIEKNNSLALNKFWKYQPGDDLKFSDIALNASSWKTFKTNFNLDSISYKDFPGIGWFRLHLRIDSSLINKPLALIIQQDGASEIYLDNELIVKYGEISMSDTTKEVRYNPQRKPLVFQFKDSVNHIISVRYAHHLAWLFYKKYQVEYPGFSLSIQQPNDAFDEKYSQSIGLLIIFLFFFIICITLAFLHFLLFLFNRSQKSNLYYSIFVGGFGIVFLWLLLTQLFFNNDFNTSFSYHMTNVHVIYLVALAALVYSFYYDKMPKIFYVILLLAAGVLVLHYSHILENEPWFILLGLVVIETFRVTFLAIKKKRKGAWIIGIGIIAFISYFLVIIIISMMNVNLSFSDGDVKGLLFGLLSTYGTLSIPISMSIYLARDFAHTSKNLKLQLKQVEALSAKTLEQEKEKQQILSRQKEDLEKQVAERTAELAQKNKDITDSISYAQRIQKAILPSEEIIQQFFPNSFIYFRPKDIVSGDFYWFHEANDKLLFAVADCTGHGVPGAFMSMLGSEKLTEAASNTGDVSEILTILNKSVKKTLKQDDSANSTRDGMDIAICSFNKESNSLSYAGANRPLWIIKNNSSDLIEIKATKTSIGGLTSETQYFENHKLELDKGDSIYLCSDGYADQFSQSNKKLMTKKFKDFLTSIQKFSMKEQKAALDKFFLEWKGNMEQTDDVLVIGIKID